MDELKLVTPTEAHRTEALKYKDEFSENGAEFLKTKYRTGRISSSDIGLQYEPAAKHPVRL